MPFFARILGLAIWLTALVPAAYAQSSRDFDAEITAANKDMDYARASVSADAFVAEVRQSSGEDSLAFAKALSRKAEVLHLQYRMLDADPLYDQVIALFRKHNADDGLLSTALNNIGMQHRWLGRFSEAARALEESLVLRERLQRADPAAVAQTQSNLALVYGYLGRHAEALAMSESATAKAAEIADPDSPIIGQTLQNRASDVERLGRFDEAERMLLQALEVNKKAFPPTHPVVIGVQNRLGLVAFYLGDHAKAERRFREALRQHQGVGATRLKAAILSDFGYNQMDSGKLTEAEALFRQSLDVRLELLRPSHPDVARTHDYLAEVLFRQGRLAEALEFSRKANAYTVRETVLSEQNRLQFLRFVKIAWYLYVKQPSQPLLEEAFLYGQRAARTNTANAVAQLSARFATTDPVLRGLIKERDELDQQIPAWDAWIAYGLSQATDKRDASFAQARARVAEMEARRDAVTRQLRGDFPGYFDLVAGGTANLSEVPSRLHDGDALVMFLPSSSATDGGVYAWGVSKAGVVWKRLKVTGAEVDAHVATLRGAMLADPQKPAPGESLFDLGIAYRLYKALFGELGDGVASSRHLLVVASGSMTSLPLQVLVTQPSKVSRPTRKTLAAYRTAAWLVRKKAVTTLPSVASLAMPAGRATVAQQPLVGFGNPNLSAASVPVQMADAGTAPTRGPPPTRGVVTGQRSVFELQPLPESETELKSVAETVGSRPDDLKVQAAATESAVKAANLSDYRIVYFATHAVLPSDAFREVQEPAIVLTPPAAQSDDDNGLLTASEVALLKLDADWVVLSACNTGIEAANQTGVSSLAEAFIHAGARAILASNWAVWSQDTAELLKVAFNDIKSDPSLSKAEAMRRGMLARISDTSEDWTAYPAMWGAFSVLGQ